MKEHHKYITINGKPLALDLFCCAGSASTGLRWAGFYVIGVDIKKPKHYYGDKFIQGDIHNLPIDISKAAFIWASPPCQLFSIGNKAWGSDNWKKHPNLIPATYEVIKDHPFYCIENVPLAPIRPDVILWGPQFGLENIWRKRIFETSFFCWSPPKPIMNRGTYYSIAGNLGSNNHFYRRKKEGKPGTISKTEAKHFMGIPICHKLTKKQIVESVPPQYAEYIGKQAMGYINKEIAT